MNPTALLPARIQKQLLPHQKRLLEVFLAPEANAVVELHTQQAGGGTRFTSVALTLLMLQQPMPQRILFLLSNSVDEASISLLEHERVVVDVVDRYRFRELLDTSPGQNIWDNSAVVFTTKALARQPDVNASLKLSKWDLVVIDDAHEPAGLASLTLTDLTSLGKRALLIFKNVAPNPNETTLQNTTVVRWTLEDVYPSPRETLDVATQAVTNSISVVQYELSADELVVWTMAAELISRLKPGARQTQWFRHDILRRLLSSPSALEQGLRQSIVKIPAIASYSSKDKELIEHSLAAYEAATRVSIRPLVEKLLVTIEQMTIDEKLFAIWPMDEEIFPRERTCVVTEYVATANYLAAALEERDILSCVYHESLSRDAQIACYDSFDKGAVLIGTRSIANGQFSLEEITELLIYDSPPQERQLQQFLAAFDGPDRGSPLESLFLRPSNPPRILAGQLHGLSDD